MRFHLMHFSKWILTIEKETKNIADKYPELVNKLIIELSSKFHNEF
mgnify:CR=1 FL=1